MQAHQQWRGAVRDRVWVLLAVLAILAAVGACDDSSTVAGDGAAGDGAADAKVVTADGRAADADGAPPSSAHICVADKAASGQGVDPALVAKYSGSNGDFTDSCTPAGNLTKYACETKTVCGPAPNPSCDTLQTGEVTSTELDCNGQCAGGTCDGRCPAEGQKVTYLSVDSDGNANFKNESDGRSYSCKLTFDQPQDNYNCKSAPFSGETARIAGLGLQGAYCTGGEFGNIAVLVDGVTSPAGQNCSYLCAIAN